MSFKNSMQNVQKFILNYTKGKAEQGLMAVLTARQFNQNITETDMGPEPGKSRTLKISYYAPVCDDDGTGSESICDSGTKIAPKQAFFTLSQTTASAVYTLAKDDIRYVDGAYTFSDHAKAQVASVLPTVRGKLAASVAAILAANVGVLPDGNSVRKLPFLDKTNGAANPMGLWEIERYFQDGGFSNPFVVGGSDVFQWKKAVEIGGINDRGQNVAQMGMTNAYYDNRINTAFADTSVEHVLAFDPQVLKFISFSKNAGIFSTDIQNIDAIDAIYQRGGTNYIEGVMVDPMTGLLWDLNVYYDTCTSEWNFQWKLTWDIFFLPPMVCNEQGVNGVFHFTTCVQNITECPDGSPITPVDTNTYEFNTSGQGSPVVSVSFPLHVDNLSIGGQTYVPVESERDCANIAALKTLLNNAIDGITFTTSGTKLQYTGYSAITLVLNDGLTGEKTLAFTEA